jgi:replication factor C subunit 3/5
MPTAAPTPTPTPTPSTMDIESHSKNDAMPWVEKYRPSCFDEIVLDPMNRMILSNILKTNYFPNLLFYGPPGTGKTTTIINLVNAYQSKLNMRNRGLMIHLNASDERGIDIIRNQINSFVSTKSMFGNGIKFVILDEVDYMTTNAQIALRYLLTSYTDNNVRFCLICNYVSRIDESLQTEFVRMRFNQLPEADILVFLRKIRDNEKLSLTDLNLVAIQRQFHSDIRSMINYIQTNQEHLQELHVITNSVWGKLVELFRDPACDIATIKTYFREIGERYYIDPRTIIKNFMYYIVRHQSDEMVSVSLLNSIEHIIHLHHIRNEYVIHYFILKIRAYFQCLPQQCADAPAPAPPAPAPPPVVKGKRVIKVKKTKTAAATTSVAQ